MADDKDDALADVRASIEQLSKGGDAAPQPAREPDQDAPPSEAGDDAQAALDTVAQRARDPETGKFIKAPDPSTRAQGAADEPRPASVKATTEAVEPTQPAPSTAQAVRPPTSWSPEAKAEWAKLSPALQQAVLKREEEVSSGFKQKSDELRRWQELDGIIGPRRSYYQRFGFKSDVEAINHLLTLSDSIERDPAGTLAHLARHYNVDPAKLTGGQPAQPQQQQFQQPQQQQQPVNIAHMIREEIGMARAAEIVQEFEQNPPEHYQSLKPTMKMLLESGQANDMQDAYDKAAWMNPDVRQKMLEAKLAEDETKRAAAQKQAIEKKTKAANASLSGAPHGTPATRQTKANGAYGEVTDDVRAAVAQLSG